MAQTPMTKDDYTIDALRGMQKTLPAFKLRYAKGERGWASDLGGGFAIVNNIPFSGPLRYLDVVEVVREEGSLPRAGKVVWRAYPCTALVRYPSDEARKWYRDLWELCQERGWAVEGAYAGLCMVCLPEGVELGEELAQAGLEGASVELDCDG